MESFDEMLENLFLILKEDADEDKIVILSLKSNASQKKIGLMQNHF